MKIYFMISILIFALLLGNNYWAQSYINGKLIPDKKEVKKSIEIVNKLATKEELSSKEILMIFNADKIIGEYLICVPLDKDEESIYQQLDICGVKRDSILIRELLMYINKHLDRFTKLELGGNDPCVEWEPNDYWLKKIKKVSEDCIEAKEISFELDFQQFIRQYDIDREGTYSNCEDVFEYALKNEDGSSVDEYKRSEVENIIKECKEMRARFSDGKKKLLEKYHNAPFTKKLRNINTEQVIIYHSFNC